MIDEVKQLIHNELHELSPKWLNTSGDTVEIPCYFCGDDKNLSISLSKLIYHCWACDSSGTLYKLFQNYGTAKGKAEFDLLEKKLGKAKRQKSFQSLFEIEYKKQEIILPKTLKYYGDIEKSNNPYYQRYVTFLKNRYLSRELIYQLNTYVDDDKVWFLSYDKLGNLNFALNRNIYKSRYSKIGEDKNIIFNEYTIDWSSPIFLLEGIFDSARIKNSIPLLGMLLPEDSLLFKKILYYKPTVYILLDNEKKATANAIKIATAITKYIPTLPIYIGETIGYKDVGLMPKLDYDHIKFHKFDFTYKINASFSGTINTKIQKMRI